jgi:uncharacterized protein
LLLPVSLTTAAALAFLHIWLSMRVSQVRRAVKVAVGDGGNELLIRRMRAHANFVENAPFLLGLLILMELAGANNMFLWAAAIAFILARLIHPFGMDRGGANWMRMIGIGGSLIAIGALAIWAVVLSYSRLSAPVTRHDGTTIQA